MASSDFCRILTLLRKERGITQKEAAAALGISQALLSHYEKGVRECGLGFVVRAADYYEVSCDYLLGRSSNRTGITLTVDELPDEAAQKDSRVVGSVLSTLNKKLIINSISILYGILHSTNDKRLVGDVSSYLMAAVYRVFRKVYSANPKNQANMFTVSQHKYEYLSAAMMEKSNAEINEHLGDGTVSVPRITTESLSKDYPLFAPSLHTLVHNTEKGIEQ